MEIMAICPGNYSTYEIALGVFVATCDQSPLGYGADAYIASSSSVGMGMTQDDFQILGSWALLMFVLAFGFKAIRKRIAPKL